MNTSAIVAIVMGVLMMVLSFTLYPTLNNAMDDLYLYWTDSCELGGDRFVRAYAGVTSVTDESTASNVYATAGNDKGKFFGSGITVVESDSGVCMLSDGTIVPTGTTSPQFWNERGDNLGTFTLATAGTVVEGDNTAPTSTRISTSDWVDVPSLLQQFGGIGQLVLSVMPILVLASFLGLVAMGLIEYGRGMSAGGIGSAVGLAILQLIVVIVILEVLPTIIDAMVDANQVATGGSLSVNEQFSGIMGIIFAALPLLLIVGILGISGFMLFQRHKRFRASGGFGMGG